MQKHFFMTLLAAGFVAKGEIILMTSSSVATGLAHTKLIIGIDKILTQRAMFRQITNCHFYPTPFQVLKLQTLDHTLPPPLSMSLLFWQAWPQSYLQYLY